MCLFEENHAAKEGERMLAASSALASVLHTNAPVYSIKIYFIIALCDYIVLAVFYRFVLFSHERLLDEAVQCKADTVC